MEAALTDDARREAGRLQRLANEARLKGDLGLALEYCHRARELADLETLDSLEARIRRPGDHYTRVIARILDEIRPRTYVEVGVADGGSFQLAKPPIVAIGIDPEPRLPAELAGQSRVFAETSDAFFANHDLTAELGGLPVDLAFIDGMHHFEYALRDFIQLERHSDPQATILIHDCYPLNRETAERERRRLFWSGDVWRIVPLLRKYRSDLSVHTIATPPTGLGVVRGLDPRSRVLPDDYDRIVAEFMAFDYAAVGADAEAVLNLVPNEWEQVKRLLSPDR